MSMLRLCTLDPSKYGWTAIGGISNNLLVPHELARRPEARDMFLKRHDAAAASDPDRIGDNVDEYYTIADTSSSRLKLPSSSSKPDNSTTTASTAAAAATLTGANGTAAELTADAKKDTKKSTTANALKEIIIHATTTTTNTTNSINTIDDAHDIHSKSSPISQSIASSKKQSSPTTTTTITTNAKANANTKLDIYTYHRGRVGQEPRNPSTGELLCDMDPVDTNYGWVPGKNAVCKVTINFPLVDLNDDDDDDDDEEEEKDNEFDEEDRGASREKTRGSGFDGEELTMSDSRRRDDDNVVGGMSANYARPSRGSRSSGAGGDGGAGSSNCAPAGHPSTLSSTTSSTAAALSFTAPNHPQLPHFVQVIDWDLANPHTPTPEVYATSIASEFGLSFPQTMDLMESIERQLRAFCASQPLFYAPMAILDPYGCERPDAHFGPPETYCGPVLSIAATATSGGGGGAGVRPYVVRRMNSNHATGGGGSSSNSRRGGGSSASRPPGAVKPDKRGIHVVPKDQLVLPNKDGDVYVAEVLQRAKSRSMAAVMECGKRGEASLTTTKNEVCHICHNRKECGLTFHCGVHNYCDFHCATRLGFRVGDYDSTQPLNLPINFCPVCALICLCAKCTRRLEDVSQQLKKESQKQNVGPKDTIMENVYDLCSFKLKNDANVTAKQRGSKDNGSSKKVKIEQPLKNKGEGKDSKRRHSSGSVIHDNDDAIERAGTISSRSMRSSPSSEAVVDERHTKKRKLEKPTSFVSVLKVHPSAFPKEMCCGEDLDPSTPEDMSMVFGPDGGFPMNESVLPLLDFPQKYQDLRPPFAAESHFYQCVECGSIDGDFVLCKECPRAYHEKCLANSNSSIAVEEYDGNDAVTLVRGRHLKSPCKRCECDRKVMDSEMDENPESKINESQRYATIGMLLCELQKVLKKLTDYDYGDIFATPVKTEEVPDYLQVITKPMDYGTIATKLETRQYVISSDDLSKTCSGIESLTDMEKAFLQAVMDVLQVHHNCFLYNPEGSNYYRAGKVQEKKWGAYFNKMKRSISELVSFQLIRFREDCTVERTRIIRSRHFEAKKPESKQCKPVAVFDPDTKRIVKQYSSKVSARSAAVILSSMGYACESELTSNSAKTRLDSSKDPMKPLFGYQWLPTEELKSGLFQFKPYFRSDDLVSPTPNNMVILKVDAAVGDVPRRGFASEDAAYCDWLYERSKSFTTSTSVDAPDESSESRADFLTNYLDGNSTINGVVWNRADNQGTADARKLTSKSPGKVVMEEEHAPMSPKKKKKKPAEGCH